MDMKHGGRPAFCAIVAAVALVLGGVAAHAQTISGVSGTLSAGNTVIISGSGFGTKATAAPVQFSNFENGAQGAVIATSDGWNSVDGWSGTANAHTGKPIYDAAAAHTGSRGMTCRYVGDVYNSSVLKSADFSGGFYIDAWYRYQPANPASRNHKLFMLYGTGTNEFPQAAMTGFCNLDDSIEIPFYAGPSNGDAEWMGLHFNHLVGAPHHIQVWLKPSTPGVQDGRSWVAVDGTVHSTATDLLTNMPGIGTWRQVRVGYYMAHDGLTNCPSAGDAWTFWDDVYLDTTPARIELGNAATYGACTHREIQIPSAWSDSQVSLTMNTGTFDGGQTAWLYVVNANNVVSPGFQVTLGGTASSGPGQPGKPVFE